MKKLFVIVLLSIFVILLAGCSSADVASYNLSKEADMFRIDRRIVFYNGITDNYILVIEGKCSLGNSDTDGEVSITCKTGENEYYKYFLGLSDNVTYFVEQLKSRDVSDYNYKVIFKPEAVIPDIELDINN